VLRPAVATVFVGSAQVVLRTHFWGGAQNVIEGSILEHQDDDVLDGIVWHNSPSMALRCCGEFYMVF
jgi:hypothetical protein